MPAQIIDALEPAVRAGILKELEPAHFAFTHILVRDAAEDALSIDERSKLHARASDALSREVETVDVLVERARHELGALRDGAKAAELALRAASLLEARGAADRAYAMHLRIEEAARLGLDVPPTTSSRLHVARLAQDAGRWEDAQKICISVIEEARAKGDAELLARAALRMGSEIRPALVDATLVKALDEAVRLLPKDSKLGCVAKARLAAALQPHPKDPMMPVAMAREATTTARTLGDASTLLEVLHLAGAALVDVVPPEDRLDEHRETLDLALAADDLPKAHRALARIAIAQVEAGDVNETGATIDRILDLSARMGHPRHRWRALFLSSMRALMFGDLATSDRAIVEVEQLAAANDDPALMLSYGAHLSLKARLLHRDDEIRHAAAMLQQERTQPAIVIAVLNAGLHARLEEKAVVASSLSQVSDFEYALFVDGIFALLIAEAAVVLEDRALCERARNLLTPHAHRHMTSGHVGISYEGTTERVLGILDGVLGDHDRGEQRLKGALAFATTHGLRPWIAQGHYDLAQLYLRAEKRDLANESFERAATIGEELGMTGLVQRAWARLERTEQKIEKPSTERSSFAMTREGDVWRIEHGGRMLRVKSTRGIELLARLVERRGEEIHVLALASDDAGSSLFDGGGDDALDARAKRELKARLDDLEDELTIAERNADRGRISKLMKEKEAIEAEINKAFSLGKGRVPGSPSERARVNVQRRLKDAITRIGELDASVGRFLQKAVRSGTYCCFLF